MRSIAKIFGLSAPLALLCAACGGSDTYVQPQPQPQPAVVVQPAAQPAPPPASTTKVEVEHND